MRTEDVRLPNGYIIKGVPLDTSKDVIKDAAIKNGWAAAADFGVPAAKEAPVETPLSQADELWQQNQARLPASLQQGGRPVAELPSLASIGGAVAGNMDIPGGIAGSMAGAKIGAAGGLPGVIAGGVIGGAVGTFGGSIVSDYLESGDVDFSDASKNAAISAGMDMATLGAATRFKPVAKLMGFGDGELSDLWRIMTGPDPFGRTAAQVFPVGSPESLRQTQSFLEEGGGSLTAFQTGNASALQNISEGIGRIGIGSSSVFRNLDQRNAATIGSTLQGLMDESLVPSENLGAMVYGIIQAGQESAQQLYGKATADVGEQLSGRLRFKTGPLVAELRKFVGASQKDWGVDLGDETLSLISKWDETLSTVPSMDYDSLMAFQKRLNGEISEMGKNAFGKTQATPASRELAQLAKTIRERTASLISDASPEAGAKLKAANAAYGEALDGILPKINANVIAQADKGSYESIAKVIEGSNPNQVEAFMNSIDVAFNNAKLAGVDLNTLDVPSPEAARAAVKAGWLKNMFSDVTAEGFDSAKFAAKATEFKRPVNARRAKAVLGKDYATFQMLLNAMAESTKQRSGFVGSLVLRSKEAGAVQGIAAGFAGASGALPAAGAIFLGPVLLAKAATRPAAVRALLDGNRRAAVASAAGKISVASDITTATMTEVMNMFSEEDQAEIRNSYR